jgi:hypothetical protein
MLDLSGSPSTVAGVTVAPDSDGAGSEFVLPPPPQLASGPDIQLLRFVRDGALAGGFLRIGIDLAVADGALAAATAALTDENAGKLVTLIPLPLVSAEAELVFYGRDQPASPGDPSPLVARHYGTSVLELNPPHHGVFAITLTAEGVRLVESGMRAGEVPIGVLCRLTAEGLWPASRVTARVDWRSVYDHFSSEYKAGALLVGEDVSQLIQRLVQERSIEVNVVSSAAPDAGPAADASAVSAALSFIQTDLVQTFCQPLLPPRADPAKASLGDSGELLDLGAAYEVKALTRIETATASYDFQQATVVRRILASQAPLGDLLAGADPAGFIADAGTDNPFFRQFHLDCRTARPLAESHLAEVLLDISYGSASGSVRLTDQAPSGRFDSFADASPAGTWSLAPRVTFAPDSPVDAGKIISLAPIQDTSRDVTLDLDAMLGLVRLDIEGATDPRVLATVLTVSETSGGVERAAQQLSLTAAQRTGSVWFRDHRAGDTLTVSGLHLLADGRQITISPTVADTRLFRLPNPFAGSITVQIVTDTVWTDLTRVVVGVQKDSSAPVRTFAFDAPGSAAVALDQPDPTDRSYRYQISRVVAGVSTQDPWLVTDVPLLQAGRASAAELVVDVEPVGPELPAAGLRSVQVELLYVDAAHQVRAEHTVVITAKSDSYRWHVPLTDPTLRSYQYRITKQLLQGGTVSTGWIDSSDQLLPVALTAS